MITQRFRPVVWVVGVAAAATTLYMISLQVAAERGRLEEVDRRIAQTRRDIRQLQTELGTRANLRQLERWNGEVLALSAPGAEQYLADERALAGFDQGVLAGKTDTPAVMFAEAAALSRADQPEATPQAAPQPVAVPVRVAAVTQVAPAATAAVPALRAVPAPRPKVVEADARAKLTRRDKEAQQVLTASAPPRSVKPRTVASLNKEFLDSTTLGDIGRAARAEAGKGGSARQ